MTRYKKAKSLNNVWTYIIILAFFAIFITIIIKGGEELLEKDLKGEIELDSASIQYIGNIKGVDLSNYSATKEQWQTSQVTDTAGTPKDYAMEFLFSKEKGSSIENTIKQIYSLPSTTVVIMFNQPEIRFKWFIDIIGWVLMIGIGIVIYYYIRAISQR